MWAISQAHTHTYVRTRLIRSTETFCHKCLRITGVSCQESDNRVRLRFKTNFPTNISSLYKYLPFYTLLLYKDHRTEGLHGPTRGKHALITHSYISTDCTSLILTSSTPTPFFPLPTVPGRDCARTMAGGNKSRDFVIHAVGRERVGSSGWEKHLELRTQHPGPDVGDGGGADAEAKLGNRLCQCTLFTRDFSGFPKRGFVGCHSYEVEWLKALTK